MRKALAGKCVFYPVHGAFGDLDIPFLRKAFDIGIDQTEGDVQLARNGTLGNGGLLTYFVKNSERNIVVPVRAGVVHDMNTIMNFVCFVNM